jgi:hypothetical protein
MKILSPLFFGLLLASCVSPIAIKTKPKPAVIAKPAIATRQSSSIAATNSTKQLMWNTNSPTELVLAYKVYEVMPRIGTTPAYWRNIGSANVPGFSVTGLTGSIHIYAVTAFNAVESPKSVPLIVRL